MNRKDRRAQGIVGKKSGEANAARQAINTGIKTARELNKKGMHAEAQKLYDSILAYEPDNLHVLIDLGLDAQDKGDFDRAEDYFARAIQSDGNNPEALVGMALTKLDQGELRYALKLGDKAAKMQHSPYVMCRLGLLYREAGKLDAAEKHLTAAIEQLPEYVPAYYSLYMVRKFGADAPYLDRLQAVEKKKDTLSIDDRMKLEFTLGKAYFDLGESDKAFAHYAEGNKIKRGSINYLPELHEKYIDSVIRLFDEKTVKQFKNAGSVTSDRPIFVVGMMRSGSTMVDQILSSHPQCGSIGESKILAHSIPAYQNVEVPNYVKKGLPSITQKFMDDMSPAMLDGIGNKYLELMDRIAGKEPRIIDKMLYSYIWAGLLRLALPNAKIINTSRDPVDTGLSIWTLLFREGAYFAYDQKEIGRYYLAYKKLMNHWNALFPGEIYEASYEKMVADQETETRKLLDFCNLPFDERCLRFHESERQVKTASQAQVRQPIYKDSVKKWKKYEQHLQPLIETLQKGGAM